MLIQNTIEFLQINNSNENFCWQLQRPTSDWHGERDVSQRHAGGSWTWNDDSHGSSDVAHTEPRPTLQQVLPSTGLPADEQGQTSPESRLQHGWLPVVAEVEEGEPTAVSQVERFEGYSIQSEPCHDCLMLLQWSRIGLLCQVLLTRGMKKLSSRGKRFSRKQQWGHDPTQNTIQPNWNGMDRKTYFCNPVNIIIITGDLCALNTESQSTAVAKTVS